MKNITAEEKNLWLSNSQPKELKIELTPDEDTINYIKNSYVMPCGMQIDSSGCPTMGTISYKSDGSALVTNNSSNLRIYHSAFQGLAGTFTISAEYKDVSGEQHHQFQLSFIMSDGTIIHTDSESKQKTIPYKDGWDICYYTFSVPSGCTAVTVWFRSGADYTKYTHSYYIRRPQLIVGNDVVKPITLTNSDILSESLEISQILESKKTLTFGDVNASSLKFKCRDIEKDVRGWGLEAVLTFKEFPQYSRKVFKGILYTQNNQNHEDVTTSVVAYDPIKSIFALDLTDWWANLEVAPNSTFQTYCALVINKLASEVGCNSFSSKDIELLANLNQKIEAKPDLIADFKNVSGEMLIKWIAQACNVYIQYDAELNKLKAVKLKLMGEALVPNIGLHPRVGLYPSAGVQDLKIPKGEYITATYEPYKTEKIDQVIITDKGNIGEGQYPVQEDQGENVLFVDGNPFLWSMNMMECAEVIYNRVHDVYFTPSTIKTVGTVFMELGDVVRVSTVKNVINSYILKRTLKGINSIKDTFTNKSEQYQSPHNPSYADVTDLQAQSILRIQADIVELRSLVAEDISADRITSGKLDAKKVTIDNLEVKASMIAGTISADKISGGTLDFQHVTAKNLDVGTINADKIIGGTLDFQKVSIKNLSVGNGNISSLYATKIYDNNGNSIFDSATNTIYSSKISSNVFSGRAVTAQDFRATRFFRMNYNNRDYGFAPEAVTYRNGSNVTTTRIFLTGQLV